MNNKGVVLITGGSRGIGAATAPLLAAAGYTVAINYRKREDAALEVVAALEDAGGSAFAVQADVANESDIKRMFAEIDEKAGEYLLTGLVNSAGIDGNKSVVTDFDAEKLNRLFTVNVVGTMLCCREAVQRMSSRRGGRGGAIVNVSSMSATIGGRAGASDYAASKAAVDTFTVGLAKEVGREGIRVNSVRPGMTSTDMIEPVRSNPALLAEIASTISMNRVAAADEIAAPIAWLLSEQASFISGACLDASGGGFIIGERLS